MNLKAISRNVLVSVIATLTATAALSDTTDYTLVLSPLGTTRLQLNVPSVEECTTNITSSLFIEKCLTPNATVTISGSDLNDIKIAKRTKIVSTHGEITIAEITYSGKLTINNQEVDASFAIKEKNGIPLLGNLTFARDQSYVVVPQ